MTEQEKMDVMKVILDAFCVEAVIEGVPVATIIKRTAKSSPDTLDGDFRGIVARTLIEWASEDGGTLDEAIVTMTNEIKDREIYNREQDNE